MALPAHTQTWERIWHYLFRIICGLIMLFLVLPVLVIIPLSFNAEPYFTFTPGMLRLDASAFSLRWYADIFENGMADPQQPFWTMAWLADVLKNSQWIHSAKNSVIIAIGATFLSTVLGTMAALGLSKSTHPARNLIVALLISPMVVPIIITATGLFFAFSKVGLSNSLFGIILAHTVLGAPFVVITVTAALSGFDHTLVRAGQMLGASPLTVFYRITLPLILPGIVAGALFAFVTSFDEVVTVLFLADYDQRTIPRQMWSGLREQISPTILAVASIMVLLSILLLTAVEVLRRRSEQMRG